jgi:hypothetical protein
MATIINSGKFEASDGDGVPYAGGELYTYLAGSAGATPKATYSDAKLTTPNANPVVLDADGRADVWVGGGSYLLILKDSLGNTVWSVDDYLDEIGGVILFDTVVLMKAESLAVGETVMTRGYYTKGDGGGATYLTVAPQAFDGYGDHELANGNIAVLQHSGNITALQYGCKGDDSTEDTLPMQAFITYCGANNVEGDLQGFTYLCDHMLIDGNTIIRGNGATIHAIDSLATGLPVLLNTNWAAVGATLDNNIIIEDIEFIDESGLDRGNALVAFSKCTNLFLDKITVTDNQYQGLAIGGCVDVYIDDLKLSGCGKAAVTSNGGDALWIGAASSDSAASNNIFVSRPTIASCEWSGILATGSNIYITNPSISEVKEAGIFGESAGVWILGGEIKNITKKFISAAGIELGGYNINIGSGLAISNVSNVAVALTDAQQWSIDGLTTYNCRRDAATYPTAGHIAILSLSAFPSAPWHGSITGHKAYDSSSPSASAVQVVGQSPGGLCLDININGNNYAGTVWTSKAIDIDKTYWGSGCVHENNIGVNGVSADNGTDASALFTPGVDEEVQRFDTTLTQNITVTLDTSGVYNGAKFRVVRTGLGAFTIAVGGLKTIPSATAAFVDVEHNGTAWGLTGYGLL